MSMESFYGGRQGASFIIVKQFDKIKSKDNEPDYEKYKIKYYATKDIPEEGITYLLNSNNNFIERSGLNYSDYSWTKTICNGRRVVAKRENETEIISALLPEIESESMVDCFSQGGVTTNEVNYGEYVIIDTPDKSNPDNGKVFQRGMDYDPQRNDLAGARYIGQIVGPKGDVPDIEFKNYNSEVLDNAKELIRTVNTNDLIPGVIPGETSTFNDTVQYKYVNIIDEFGDLTGYYIGIQSPYTMIDFTANSADPYLTENLISKNTDEDGWNENNNSWTHPFYQKWDIKVPHGIHGEDIDKLEIVFTKTKPKNFGNEYKDGVNVYADAELTEVVGVIETEVDILREAEGDEYSQIYDASPDVLYCKIMYEGNECYVRKVDCHSGIYRYLKNNYDKSTPKVTCHYISLDLFDNVYLQTAATGSELPGTGDQKIHVQMTNGETKKDIPIGEPINYIIETLVVEDSSLGTGAVYGHLLVYFSDPVLRSQLKEQFPERIVTYPSSIYEDVIFDEWFDLGQTRGTRVIPILTSVNSVNALYNGTVAPGNGIPPERLNKKGTSTPIDESAKGWGVEIRANEGAIPDIYVYDYDTKEWINSGTLDTGNVDPKYIIAKSKEIDGNVKLNPGGIWLAQEKMTYADLD